MRKLALALSLAAAPAFGAGIEIDVAGSTEGTIVIDLFEDVAPQHAARISELAAEGAYDGVIFHRVIDGFMAQTGDVQCGVAGATCPAGSGGSDGPNLPAEFSDIAYERGIVGMARRDNPNSANSQFFIMFAPAPHLTGSYTVVGEVTSGMDVVEALKRGNRRSGAISGAPDVMQAVRATD